MNDLRKLIRKLGKREAAKQIGVTERTLNYWLAPPPAFRKPIPVSKRRQIRMMLEREGA
jgi:hypothetical protein